MHPSDAGEIPAQLRHGRSLSDEAEVPRKPGFFQHIIGTAIVKGKRQCQSSENRS